MVACGGISGDITLNALLFPAASRSGVLLKLVTELINLAMESGNSTLFVYTRSHNEIYFTIADSPHWFLFLGCMVLMENSGSRLTRYLQQLAQWRKPGKRIAAIVMNANPFTNGHLHLIRYASSHFDCYTCFWSTKMPPSFRLRIASRWFVKRHKVLKLTVHPGSQYMISRATFSGLLSERAGARRTLLHTNRYYTFPSIYRPGAGYHTPRCRE